MVITSKTPDSDMLIKNATKPKQIVLMTREFGRGTDFVCY